MVIAGGSVIGDRGRGLGGKASAVSGGDEGGTIGLAILTKALGQNVGELQSGRGPCFRRVGARPHDETTDRARGGVDRITQ